MIWHELGPFTVFDVETTGMSPVRDRIVEIAALRIDRDGRKSRFSTSKTSTSENDTSWLTFPSIWVNSGSKIP